MHEVGGLVGAPPLRFSAGPVPPAGQPPLLHARQALERSRAAGLALALAPLFTRTFMWRAATGLPSIRECIHQRGAKFSCNHQNPIANGTLSRML